MPRKPRFFLPGVPAHIVQRGHSRDPSNALNANMLKRGGSPGKAGRPVKERVN